MSVEKVHILAVDDDSDDLFLIEQMLKEGTFEQWELTTAKTLADATQEDILATVDVVLLDVHLPDTNGVQSLSSAIGHFPNKPVIIMTGLRGEELGRTALQDGAQDYLVKGDINSRALCRSITYAIERKLLEDSLLSSERLAGVGTLAAGVAHEFNNINNIIISSIQLVRKKHSLEEGADHKLQMALSAALRATEITKSLLTYARNNTEALAPTRLDTIIKTVMTMFTKDMLGKGIDIDTDLAESPAVLCDCGAIEQVLLNLLINAQHALMGRDQQTIRICTQDRDSFGAITVQDNGCGISPENIKKIFSPFYSTKGLHNFSGGPMAQVSGTGLGLSICQRLVRQQGGQLHVESEPGVGSTFTVLLPKRAPVITPPTGAE